MAAKTHRSDAAGLAKVIEKLRKDHPRPHAYIASQIGISRQAVGTWKSVPPRFVAQIEKLSGIPRDQILPHTLKQLQQALGR